MKAWGTGVFVTNFNDNTVSVISAPTNTVSGTTPVGTGPAGVVVNPVSGRIYVANYLGSTVSMLGSGDLSAPFLGPVGVAVNSTGSVVYVANQGIDTVTLVPGPEVPVGHRPVAFGRFVSSSASFKVPGPSSHLGVFRGGQWFLDRSGNRRFDGCGQDRCLDFGLPGDTAVTGNWTGTGKTKIGVVRDGVWLLDFDDDGQFSGCDVDACFDFAPSRRRRAADAPVAGDWNATGRAGIGVFRDGVWLLDVNGNGRWDGCDVDACPTFGSPGDVPVVGDWTGTGRAEIGVFRDGVWLLDLNGNRQWDGCDVDACFVFGLPGDRPVVGDWDGTGYARVGVLRDGAWFLDLNGNGRWDDCGVDACAVFGLAGDQVAVGNW